MSKVRKGIDLGREVESSLSAIHARSAGNRPKGRSYLIVCEGTKTEPQYFESLRKSSRVAKAIRLSLSERRPIHSALLNMPKRRSPLGTKATILPITTFGLSSTETASRRMILTMQSGLPRQKMRSSVQTRRFSIRTGMQPGAMRHLSSGISSTFKRIREEPSHEIATRKCSRTTLPSSTRRTTRRCSRSSCHNCNWQSKDQSGHSPAGPTKHPFTIEIRQQPSTN